MEVKIAHCADIHLGFSPKNLKKRSDERRAEIKQAFFDMINKIQEEKVELLLISGDLFDDVNVPKREVSEVKSAFDGLNTKIAIIPGNHDPFTLDSPYQGNWPSNVYILKEDKITGIEMQDIGTKVWGSNFVQGLNVEKEIRENVVVDKNLINIWMLHGTLGADSTDFYNPISSKVIKDSKMDYVALGHIHKKSEIMHKGKTYYAYPGCIEGMGFDEPGEKGFYLGTISKNLCDLKFIKTSHREYCEICVDITELNSSNEAIDLVLKNMEPKFSENYKNNIYKIIFIGTVFDDSWLDLGYIEKSLEESGVFFVKICDETQMIADTSGANLKSIFYQKMKYNIDHCNSEEERLILNQALKLGMLSFSREVVFNDN